MKNTDQLEELGYCVLTDLISPSQCDRYVELLESNYKDYSAFYAESTDRTSHGLENKSLEKVVYNLHNKDLSWYKLFEHTEVLNLLDGLLLKGSYKDSEPYYMNNNSARCPLKGNPGQQLHSDSRLPGVNYCIVANVLWALDDFTRENGATRLVPGSHKFMDFTQDGKIYDEEIIIPASKGSAIIFNANLWHGGGPNDDGTSRWAVALGYARWFIKPSFDYMKNTPNAIWEQLTDQQRRLLGYDLVPPKDEFTRVRRRSAQPEIPEFYTLPEPKK